MKTCCDSGKARVYYQIPSPGGLKIRLKGETKWTTLSASEKLTSTCQKENGQVQGGLYKILWSWTDISGNHQTALTAVVFTGKITEVARTNNFVGLATNGGNELGLYHGGAYEGESNIQWEAVRQDGTDPYQFKVTGTESGNTYLDITVNECPDVQEMPCKWGKEQHFDVEMPTLKRLFPKAGIPPYGIVDIETCLSFNIVNGEVFFKLLGQCSVLPNLVVDCDGLGLLGNQFNKDIKSPSIKSPSGCPDPKVRIECCPKGICGQDKKCPKETDCEYECNGFRCCYHKGKLIKSIKL